MFKFKNKLKFGSSNDKQQSQQSQQSSSHNHHHVSGNGSVESTPPPPASTTSNDVLSTPKRTPSDSRRTISVNQVSNDVSKLSVKDDSPDKQSTLHSSASSGRNVSSSGDNNTDNQISPQAGVLQPTTTDSNITTDSSNYNNGSPSSSHPTSVGQATSAASNSNDTTNAAAATGATASPGLLTVKIYGSQNIQLPIKINNNKQILHALAINSSSESVGQQLMKNMATVEKENDVGEFIQGANATKLLPSIITIPKSENLVKSLLYLTIEFENNVLVIEPQKGTVNQSTWNQVVSFDVTNKSSSINSNSQFLNLNLFMRLPNVLIPDSEKHRNKQLFTNYQVDSANKSMTSNSSNTSSSSQVNIGDLLIGTIKLPLNTRSHTQQVRLMHHEYLKFTNYNARMCRGIVL
ncbi:unnamed protein product [Candida parapsilosis]